MLNMIFNLLTSQYQEMHIAKMMQSLITNNTNSFITYCILNEAIYLLLCFSAECVL